MATGELTISRNVNNGKVMEDIPFLKRLSCADVVPLVFFCLFVFFFGFGDSFYVEPLAVLELAV